MNNYLLGGMEKLVGMLQKAPVKAGGSLRSVGICTSQNVFLISQVAKAGDSDMRREESTAESRCHVRRSWRQ